MSSSSFEINAQVRTALGTGACGRLRRLEDRLPAVVYGGGQSPVSITLSQKEMIQALANPAVYSHILNLNIDNTSQKVVLKALQRHPTKERLIHADFLRVKTNEVIVMNIPLSFQNEGSSPGVKQGGVVSHIMTEIEVKCLPADLPEKIEVDVSGLALDASIHLSQIKLPKGVALAHEIEEKSSNQSVVSIHKPKVVADAPTEEEATEEPAEPKKEA